MITRAVTALDSAQVLLLDLQWVATEEDPIASSILDLQYSLVSHHLLLNLFYWNSWFSQCSLLWL